MSQIKPSYAGRRDFATAWGADKGKQQPEKKTGRTKRNHSMGEGSLPPHKMEKGTETLLSRQTTDDDRKKRKECL